MKRLWICAAIILVVAAVSAGSVFLLSNATDRLTDKIDRCLEYYYSDSKDDKKLDKALDDFKNEWGKYYVKASFITRSSTLEEISGIVARLKPLTKDKSDDFAAELSSIRFRVRLLYKSQTPHWRSVF